MSRILIIDDDLTVLRMLARLLDTDDVEVVTCSTVAEARGVIQTYGFNVIIADFCLSDGNGIDLIRELRRRRDTTPFIVMTGYGTIPLAVEAMRAGATHFLEKPFDSRSVVRVVHQVLEPNDVRRASPTIHIDGLRRWAESVCAVIDAPHDPARLSAWAALLRTSPETLRTWCRSAGLSPKRSLDLGRLLRCVKHAERRGCRPEDLLDAAHPRTASRLFRLGKVVTSQRPLPPVLHTLDA